jgi:hypothetical protein
MCCFGPDEKERQKIKDDELLDAAQSGDVKIARKQLETGAFRNCKESMVRHALRAMSPGAARRHARCRQGAVGNIAVGHAGVVRVSCLRTSC